MAAGSCRRPQWLLWVLVQGLLWLQVPGGPHLSFDGGWLARGQMLILLPRKHSRAAGRTGVLVYDRHHHHHHKVGRVQSLPRVSQTFGEAAKLRGERYRL